jgi:hypothetical protein
MNTQTGCGYCGDEDWHDGEECPWNTGRGERETTVIIDEDDGLLILQTPYNADAVATFRTIPGRRWEAARKVNTFPATERRTVWEALRKHYRGEIAVGAKGRFEIR